MNPRLASRARSHPRRGLDRDEAAIYVGITLATFDQMVNDGRLPKPTELDGECVRGLMQLDRAGNQGVCQRQSGCVAAGGHRRRPPARLPRFDRPVRLEDHRSRFGRGSSAQTALNLVRSALF
jgi:predicted DNA-binding transcriptional regulator AlpA